MAAQQPAKRLSMKNDNSAICITNSRRVSNVDKGPCRIPITIPRTSIGTEIEDDMKKLAKNRSTGKSDGHQVRGSSLNKTKSRLGSTKYWAWLEDMEADALDGLTEDKKEQLKMAGAARRLAEEFEEQNIPAVQEPVQQYLSRVTSEILISDKSHTSLHERAISEPSVIVREGSIFDKVKIWHPSGPSKNLTPIMKKNGGRGFINVCFEPGSKSNLPFVPRYKQQKNAPMRKTKSEAPHLAPKISIVNMSFQFPPK